MSRVLDHQTQVMARRYFLRVPPPKINWELTQTQEQLDLLNRFVAICRDFLTHAQQAQTPNTVSAYWLCGRRILWRLSCGCAVATCTMLTIEEIEVNWTVPEGAAGPLAQVLVAAAIYLVETYPIDTHQA